MRAKLFNAYTYFILGVVLITVLTFIELPCPACGGTGIIKGVTSIKIAEFETELLDHYELGMECGWDYERYTYNVKLTVENPTSTESWGVILITFHDPDAAYQITVEVEDEEVVQEFRGETLAAFPMFIEVPAGSIQTVEEVMMFEGITLEFFGVELHQIDANLASEFVCPFHDASAKVSLPDWLRLR